MRRLLGLLALMVLAGLVAACSGSPGPGTQAASVVGAYSGGPRLAFDNKLLDYGDVPFNQEVRATFQIRNVGDQRLVIKKADVSTVQGC